MSDHVLNESAAFSETLHLRVGPIREVFPLGRQYGPEQWLPSWWDAKGQSGSTWQLLKQFLAETNRFLDRSDRVYLQHWLSTAPAGEDRLRWTVPCPFPRTEPLAVTYRLGVVDYPVRRAASRHEWESASDPVWWIEPHDPRLRLRNLNVLEATLIPDPEDGVAVLPDPPLRDVDLYWQDADGVWQRYPAELQLGAMSLQFPEGLDPVQIRWASRAVQEQLADAVVTITRSGGRVVFPLASERVDNLFDAFGCLYGLPRFDDEDNLSYRDRLLLESRDPADSTVGGVIRGVASRIRTLSLVDWQAESDLALDAASALRITQVHLIGEPRLREVREDLLPQDATEDGAAEFLATWGDWRPGALVLVNGIPRNDWTLGGPGGASVLFPEPVQGRVHASYSLERFVVERDGDGYVTHLRVGAGLLPKNANESYLVAVAREVTALPVDLPDIQRARLLTAEGLPNALFLDIAHQLTASNPTALGRGVWGAGVWFTATEDRPPAARIPLPFDAHGEG